MINFVDYFLGLAIVKNDYELLQARIVSVGETVAKVVETLSYWHEISQYPYLSLSYS